MVALVSAAIEIFGKISYLVARRTREIGIRIALGARNADVIRMVITEGLGSVAWGAGIGLMVFPDAPDLTYGAGAFSVTAFLGVLTLLCAVDAIHMQFLHTIDGSRATARFFPLPGIESGSTIPIAYVCTFLYYRCGHTRKKYVEDRVKLLHLKERQKNGQRARSTS